MIAKSDIFYLRTIEFRQRILEDLDLLHRMTAVFQHHYASGGLLESDFPLPPGAVKCLGRGGMHAVYGIGPIGEEGMHAAIRINYRTPELAERGLTTSDILQFEKAFVMDDNTPHFVGLVAWNYGERGGVDLFGAIVTEDLTAGGKYEVFDCRESQYARVVRGDEQRRVFIDPFLNELRRTDSRYEHRNARIDLPNSFVPAEQTDLLIRPDHWRHGRYSGPRKRRKTPQSKIGLQ